MNIKKILLKFLKIMLYLLILIVAIVIFAILYIKFHPTFGAVSKGDSLQKIQNSPNFRNGKFQNLETTSVMTNNSPESEENEFSMFYPPKEKNPQKPLPSVKFDKGKIVDVSVTWFGHSSVLIDTASTTIMIDPVFNRASPVPIFGKAFAIENPILQNDLPKINVVVISHNHYDHLDYKAIKKFGNNVDKYFVPLGIKAYLLRWGIEDSKIVELDWYENAEFNNINFVLTPARHYTSRTVNDSGKTLWGSWVIKSNEHSIYFSGDNGYSDIYKAIGEKYGPFDIAFIEIGAYNKRWSQIHLFPEEAIQASLDLKAELTLPIHWAKFDLSRHAWDEPAIRFVDEAKKQNVKISTPLIGETFTLENAPQENWWEDLR